METNHDIERPLIVGFVSDLMFTMRISNVARHLDYRIEWLESAADLPEGPTTSQPDTPGEALQGRDGQLFRLITEWQPAMLLFDLNNDQVPWARWIAGLKSSAATRRIPIVCFGPHEDVAVMQQARDAGADAVLARSRFTADMGNLFQKYARLPDTAALEEGCRESLPELVLESIATFNEGRYHDAHDGLEEAWMQETGPVRNLYKGMLQVGIAYYQIERANYRGATKMLLRVRQWLAQLPPVCQGVDVARLRKDVDRVQAALEETGPENIGQFDLSLFRPIVIRPPEKR